jgi:hypothetical protein
LLTNQLFHLDLPFSGEAVLQTSTNKIDWISLATVTNSGAIIEWRDYPTFLEWGSLEASGVFGFGVTNMAAYRVIPKPAE